MNEVSKEGRTILFVSHNMTSLNNLCNKGIVLDSGRIIYQGSAEDSVDYYLNKQNLKIKEPVNVIDKKKSTGIIFNKFYLTNNQGKEISHVIYDESFFIYIGLNFV